MTFRSRSIIRNPEFEQKPLQLVERSRANHQYEAGVVHRVKEWLMFILKLWIFPGLLALNIIKLLLVDLPSCLLLWLFDGVIRDSYRSLKRLYRTFNKLLYDVKSPSARTRKKSWRDVFKEASRGVISAIEQALARLEDGITSVFGIKFAAETSLKIAIRFVHEVWVQAGVILDKVIHGPSFLIQKSRQFVYDAIKEDQVVGLEISPMQCTQCVSEMPQPKHEQFTFRMTGAAIQGQSREELIDDYFRTYDAVQFGDDN